MSQVRAGSLVEERGERYRMKVEGKLDWKERERRREAPLWIVCVRLYRLRQSCGAQRLQSAWLNAEFVEIL